MSNFTEHDIEVDGINVRVRELGSGPALIYLHPAGTTGDFEFLRPLARERRLIIPSHPGFGDSDDDVRIDTAADYALHYIRLFRALNLHEPVEIVGESLGGWIGSWIAALRPSFARRLILISPAGLRDPQHPTTDLFKIPAAEFTEWLFATPPEVDLPPLGPERNDLIVRQYREMTSLARFAWERNYDIKLERWLSEITSPTLLIWGRGDRIVPAEQAELWSGSLGSEVTTRTIDNAGHAVFREKTDEVLDIVRDFLEGDRTDGGASAFGVTADR